MAAEVPVEMGKGIVLVLDNRFVTSRSACAGANMEWKVCSANFNLICRLWQYLKIQHLAVLLTK